MARYVIKRVLLLIPVIIAVSFIVYALVDLAPGTIVDTMISGNMTLEDIEALKLQYNLDKSMFYRYGLYMFNLIQGDLGLSMQTGLPVFTVYMQRLPNTLLLAFSAVAIGVVISIPMGIRAARKAGTMTDTAATTFSLIGMSMPGFWLGLLLMLLFSATLGWLPAGGNKDGIRSLILPAVCCAMSLTAQCARQTRSSMLEILHADFLRTARAKGAPEETVIRKHALGNAMIPIITTIGASVCVQLAGSAVIEQVYAWPGVGRMLVEGVSQRDVTVILGCVIMTTILYVLVQLIVDLLYAFVDPRVKSRYIIKKHDTERAETTLPDPSSPSSPESLPNSPLGRGVREADGVVPRDFLQPSSPDPSYSGATDYVTRQNMSIADGYTTVDAAEVIIRYKKRSQMGELWHRLVRNKSAVAGMIILGFVFLVAIGSLFMSFKAINASNVSIRFTQPSWQYPFGTDNLGRNELHRVIYGTRYSIIVGFGSVLFSAIFGIALGSLSGFYGGKVENVLMRISDILASIPGLLLGMVIMIVLGMKLENLIVAVGVGGIPYFMRMSRASILTVIGNEYVEAARAIGYSDLRIIATQILPNGISPLIIQATTQLGISIIISASLSFLGFGVPAPTPEWGALITAGREFARNAPWMMAFPGLAIMITVLGFNLLGDGLRDALDPKLKK